MTSHGSVARMSVFNQYADDYQKVLAKNLRFVPGGSDYYNRNRVRITKRVVGDAPEPKQILDFGGGIGLAIPHLKYEFPSAVISICDASAECVAVANRLHPGIQILDPQHLPLQHFDLIFVAGVVHHVEIAHRLELLMRIINSLALGGTIVFHELNPLNPVTRRLVACCPFDEDAILIKKSELIKILNDTGEILLHEQGFSVFLPPLLRSISSVECLLRWCPIGAQYFVAVRRMSGGVNTF